MKKIEKLESELFSNARYMASYHKSGSIEYYRNTRLRQAGLIDAARILLPKAVFTETIRCLNIVYRDYNLDMTIT